MSKASIRAILSGLPDVRVEPVGTLWAVAVGGLSGARADGVGLAHDLKAQYEYIRPRPVAETPMPIGEMEIPEEIEIPRFLAPDPLEDVPESLQDLAEPDETPEAMQARMWSLWLELNGKLMLGLATTEETALHSRLHNELHWFAPPIEGET
jgi:hypothetical protein